MFPPPCKRYAPLSPLVITSRRIVPRLQEKERAHWIHGHIVLPVYTLQSSMGTVVLNLKHDYPTNRSKTKNNSYRSEYYHLFSSPHIFILYSTYLLCWNHLSAPLPTVSLPPTLLSILLAPQLLVRSLHLYVQGCSVECESAAFRSEARRCNLQTAAFFSVAETLWTAGLTSRSLHMWEMLDLGISKENVNTFWLLYIPWSCGARV